MRERFYLDKKRLDALVLEHQEMRIKQRNVGSLAHLETLAREYQEIKPFLYVKGLCLTLSDEKQLQTAAVRIFDAYESQLRAGLHHLRDELRFAKHPDTARARRIYQTLKEDFPDPSLDSFFSHKEMQATACTFEEFQSYRSELSTIFSSKQVPGSSSVHESIARVSHILERVAAQPDRLSQAEARSIANYVQDAAQRVRLDLIEHVGRWLKNHPLSSPASGGVSRLRAQELSYQHVHECQSIEHQLQVLIDTARTIPQPTTHYESQLIIGLRCDKNCDDLARTLSAYGEVERFSLIPYLAIRTDSLQAAELLRAPRALFGSRNPIIYAPRRYTVSPMRAAPNTDNDSWNLSLIRADEAWQRTRGEGSTVAVIDTGIDYRHADLRERFNGVRGINIVAGDNDPYDDHGHGTHVAGTVAGNTTGVAPGCVLYAVKVLDMNGSGNEVDVLKGMEWSIKQKVDVMNMSLGSSYPSSAEADLLAVANREGIAVCCAAGNNGDSSYGYPASLPYAISVAAVDRNKSHAPFSNHNDKLDLAAPGVSVYSTWPGGYNTLNGTSMATPHVAGACALVKSTGKNDVERILKQTAESLGDRNYFGAGLINLAEAIK